jgi:hypothetical protein
VDRHDAGNDGNVDALCADLLYPLQEEVGVVKHLCYDERSSGIDLLLQVVNELVDVVVVIAAFRVSCNTNVEVVSVLFLDVDDEVLCVAESTRCCLPLFSFTGRVSPQSQDVCAAGLVCFFQGVVELGLLHVSAGKVHAGLEAVDGLGDLDHFAGQLGVAAAGAPCEVDELRAEAMHAVHAIIEVLDTLGVKSAQCLLGGMGRAYLSGFRGEELEGEGWLPLALRLGEFLGDVHGGLECKKEKEKERKSRE